MITTRITLPRKYKAYADFAATSLNVPIDHVYGALIIAGIGDTSVEALEAKVKPLIAQNFPAKAKEASSGKAKA